MKRINKIYAIIYLILGVTLSSCNDDNLDLDKFEIKNHFLGGTLQPKSGSYTSVFFIQFKENNKAVFVSSGKDLEGEYKLTKDSLIFTVPDPNNYRIAKFALNSKHEIVSSYYKALTMEYNATGILLMNEKDNQFKGKSYSGSEYVMGPKLSKEKWHYKFDATGIKYGRGEDLSQIKADNQFFNINNNAFKFQGPDGTVELGFIYKNELTVFRNKGLYYFGKYKNN